MTSEQVPSAGGRDLLSADLIGERGFAVVRRGFDREEVQEFLKQVAAAVRNLADRAELAEEARRAAEHRALHPEINEDVLMERVGEETASILRSARATAGDMRTRAAEEAARIVEEAHQQARQIRAEAETVMGRSVEEANRAAEEIRAGAQAAGDQMVERARKEVESLRQMAEQERKLTVEGAQAIRERILADLARRRRVATVQIEQLRAGRERLLESYGLVRRTLEEVQDELQRADAEARGAADQVGRDWDEDDSMDVLPDLLGAGAGDGGPAGVAVEDVEPDGEALGEALGGAEPVAAAAEEGAVGVGATAEAMGMPVEAAVTEAAVSEAAVGEAAVSEAAVGEAAISEATVMGEGPAVTATEPAATSATSATGRASFATRPVPRRRAVAAQAPPPMAGAPSADVGERPSAALTSGVEEAMEAAAGAEQAAAAHVVTAPEPGLGAGVPPADAGGQAERVGAAGPPGPAGEEGGEASSVDGLFARIRAGREEAVHQARHVLSGQTITGEPEAANGTAVPTDSPDNGSPPVHGANGANGVLSEAAMGADRPGPASPIEDDTDSGLVRTTEDEALLERREAAIGEIEVILTRKVKRALQDEQNGLLDRLRSSRGVPEPAELLEPVAEHRQRYVDAAIPQLELAVRAGSRFAGELVKEGGRKIGPLRRAVKVDDLAADLAAMLSDQIRRRVEQALQAGRGDESALTEALGAAYRETKTQRVERAAGDQVTAAFSRGTWEAAGDRIPLRWVVEDIEGPCSDCDDNALAGALPRHEGFPTGQAHPPAHTGCRCLVVPDLH